MAKIEDFIKEHWDDCVLEGREDGEIRIGLPYPYSIPATEKFDCMYYWDTYFTNLGLLRSGRAMMAKCNVDNMLYLVNKYGFMPNGSRFVFLNRSQPPFLSEMVRDVYEYYKDPVWLKGAYEMLRKEYDFWMSERMTPVGLNRYGGKLRAEEYAGYKKGFTERVGFCPEGTDEEIAFHTISTCESGWDMTPRWDFEAYNYAQVDLNALLYMLECNMAYFAELLGEDDVWTERAENRCKLIDKYMTAQNGVLLDYNFKKESLSSVFSAASYFPLFCKSASKEQAQAAKDNLYRIEEEYGIASCEKGETETSYQWDFPNGWACLQYVVAKGLLNYGYTEDAKRIAKKYIDATEKIFDATNNLWEKYNVCDGTINVINEYKMPAMMGWTAGVYLTMKELLEEN